jgi:hypothetical protein
MEKFRVEPLSSVEGKAETWLAVCDTDLRIKISFMQLVLLCSRYQKSKLSPSYPWLICRLFARVVNTRGQIQNILHL